MNERFLNGARVYLCGPVEHSDDLGWRGQLTRELSGLGLVIWDPLVKPSWMFDVDGVMQGRIKADMLGGVREAFVINGLIRRWCLHLVSNCDIVILRCSGEFTVGTWEEVSLARFKPVLCWCDEGCVSAWLIDQLGCDIKNSLFYNSGDLVEYLRGVDSTGKVPDLIKWSFLTNARGYFTDGCLDSSVCEYYDKLSR